MNLFRRFAALFRKGKLDAEIAEELRAHLELQTRENIARGMSPQEARYAAQRAFGGVEQIKERAREQRGWVWLEQGRQDVRYAFRQLAKAPGFTAVVVLTLALGIGATTAIYSVVDAVVLNPLPGVDSEQLVQIGERNFYENKEQRSGVSPPVLESLEAGREFFADFTWLDSVQLEVGGDEFITTVGGSIVPANFFAVLGAKPLLGRVFHPEEAISFHGEQPSGDTAIVLSHAWWQSRFSGDPNALGRVVELSGRRFTVVGVMPPHFQYPSTGTCYWLPAEPFRPQPRSIRVASTRVIARLKPALTREQTQAMLDALAQRLMHDHPSGTFGYGQWWRLRPNGLQLWLGPLSAEFQDGRGAEELRRTLLGFLAAIGFVLVIVCANVANLTLARTERRQHEFAVRLALGASRWRLMRQLLTENLLLATLGGMAGLLATAWGMKLLLALNTLPRLRPVEVDGRVLGVALLVSLLTGLAFGLGPAWRAGRARGGESLGHGQVAATSTRRGRRRRGVLVILQVALTLVLLAGAGLMIRSVTQALRVEPGFDPANLLSVAIELGGEHRRFPQNAQDEAALREARNALLSELSARLAALPGVQAAGIFRAKFPAEKATRDEASPPLEILRAYSGLERSDYFRAARVPLLAGRYFNAADAGIGLSTVIVNATLAQTFWPGEDPIGKTFRAPRGRGAETQLYEVVGVVGDVRERFNASPGPTFYRPFHESEQTGMRPILLVRTERDPGGMVAAVRQTLKAMHPEMRMPVINVARQTLFDATRAQRTYRNYLLVFAGAGLLLSALGIYGVLAYSVARRTREIGIRIAVGADRRAVLALVISEGARLVGAGVGVGLLAAFGLTRFLRSQLFNVSPTDPLVLLTVALVLAMVALLACWLPARRAAKVDPTVALRAE